MTEFDVLWWCALAAVAAVVVAGLRWWRARQAAQARAAAAKVALQQQARQAAARAAAAAAVADRAQAQAEAQARARAQAQADQERAERHAAAGAARAQAQAAALAAAHAAAEAAAQAQAAAEATEQARATAQAQARTRAQAEFIARQQQEAERQARAEAARLAALATASAAPPTPRRLAPEQTLVMVADDSKVVRVKTSRLLAQHRYRVVLAEDGVQAAQLLEQEVPLVLVTDVEMPGMDGFALTRHVRNHPRARHIPIIMITSADERLKAAAAEAGVTLVLGKPYPEEALLACIEQAQALAGATAAV